MERAILRPLLITGQDNSHNFLMQEEHDRALICAVNAYPDMPVDERTRKVVFEDVGMPQRVLSNPVRYASRKRVTALTSWQESCC